MLEDRQPHVPGVPQSSAEPLAGVAPVDAGFLVQARHPRTSSPDNRAALRLIGLAALIHMLRSPRFYERVIVSAIVLAALARLGQENGASTFERLAAWNKQQVQRLEHKAERQARSLKRKAKGQQTRARK
jgi:hypothetical protein